MPILGVISSGISGHLETNSFASIATVTVGSPQATISFTSIPSTYSHLELRYTAKSSHSTFDPILFTMNGLTTSIYQRQYVTMGASNSVVNLNTNNTSSGHAGIIGSSRFGSAIVYFHDYLNTSKAKMVQIYLSGLVESGSVAKAITGTSSVNSTAAINRITLTLNSGSNFTQYSTFSLYGIEG